MKTHTNKKTPYWIIIAVLTFVAIFFLLFAIVAKQDADRNAMLARLNEMKAEQQMHVALIAKQEAEKAKKLLEEQLVELKKCCNKK
jgi:hypothetical protein